MDNSLRVWDIRPYAPADRCVKVFNGHQHNFEKVPVTDRITFTNELSIKFCLTFRICYDVLGLLMAKKYLLARLIDSCTFGIRLRDEFCTNYPVIMVALTI